MYKNGDLNDEPNGGKSASDGWWWLGHLVLTAMACFFVWFGVALLMASYSLKDPFSFIMTFFAANLIILISLVMVLGFVLRMWRGRQSQRQGNGLDPDGL